MDFLFIHLLDYQFIGKIIFISKVTKFGTWAFWPKVWVIKEGVFVNLEVIKPLEINVTVTYHRYGVPYTLTKI